MPSANEISNTVIDIAATFKALYGYSPRVIPALPAAPGPADPYNTGTDERALLRPQVGGLTPLYNPAITDMIGRPVFMPITLTVSGPQPIVINLPFSMLSIHNKKLIKETPMVERGGSVIEETGIGPWEIDLKGFIIDANNQFPDNQLAQLIQLYTADQVTGATTATGAAAATVQLQCALTDLVLGANKQVVITEMEIPMKAKVIGVRDFSMKMVQDGILTLHPNAFNTNTTVAPAIAGAAKTTALA